MTPRPWQSACLPLAVAALRGAPGGVIHACTGSGKSHAQGMVLRELDAPAFVTVPTQALVVQLASTLRQHGLDVGEWYADRKDVARVMVVCHDSLDTARDHLTGRYCLADECHRTPLDALPPVAGLLGWTATPYRASGPLPGWDRLVFAYTISDALRDGVLVPFDVEYSPTDDATDDAVIAMLDRVRPQGPGVVSAASIADAEEFADRLDATGRRAGAIHSRMPMATRRQMLGHLERGNLDVLVYPTLLSEGVDLPWLRWICLRRRLSSRVALVQTVGRVLRCHPGKTRALVLDPHDLLAQHGLTHAAALGDVDLVEPELVPDPWPIMDLPPLGVPLSQAVAVDAVGAWARAMLLAMDLEDGSARYGSGWRRDPASPKQVAMLIRLKKLTRHLPPEHRPVVNMLANRADRLRAGIASDVITVLRRVEDATAPWRESLARQGAKPWERKAPIVRVDVPFVPQRVVKALERA